MPIVLISLGPSGARESWTAKAEGREAGCQNGLLVAKSQRKSEGGRTVLETKQRFNPLHTIVEADAVAEGDELALARALKACGGVGRRRDGIARLKRLQHRGGGSTSMLVQDEGRDAIRTLKADARKSFMPPGTTSSEVCGLKTEMPLAASVRRLFWSGLASVSDLHAGFVRVSSGAGEL
jgi:hypothetical protein